MATDGRGLRDYRAWHAAYDDPASGMSWRLGVVRGLLRAAFDRHRDAIRVVSACSGDARDVLEVLGERADADRVRTTLVEREPSIALAAEQRAAALGLPGVEVRTTDAGTTDAYLEAVPADIVVLVGIFGNITDRDLATTIAAAPQFCRPGATLLWSRSRAWIDDRDADVRRGFDAAGFTELDHVTLERGSRPTVGCVRYDGPPVELRPRRRLFTFVR